MHNNGRITGLINCLMIVALSIARQLHVALSWILRTRCFGLGLFCNKVCSVASLLGYVYRLMHVGYVSFVCGTVWFDAFTSSSF